MNIFLQQGFLSKAPLFIDITTVIVAILPLLVWFAIRVAQNGNIELHKKLQLTLFIFSVIVLVFFEYFIRVIGGVEKFELNIDKTLFFTILIIHIIIAVVTLFLWIYTIIKSSEPTKHKKAAIFAFSGIVLTSITGIIVYILLFLI